MIVCCLLQWYIVQLRPELGTRRRLSDSSSSSSRPVSPRRISCDEFFHTMSLYLGPPQQLLVTYLHVKHPVFVLGRLARRFLTGRSWNRLAGHMSFALSRYRRRTLNFLRTKMRCSYTRLPRRTATIARHESSKRGGATRRSKPQTVPCCKEHISTTLKLLAALSLSIH